MHINRPITVYVSDATRAKQLAAQDKNARAMTSGPGTLMFHRLIAEHGAGEFETLYVPAEFKGKWKSPVGGKVYQEGEMKMNADIEYALKQGPSTTKEIARVTGNSISTIQKAVGESRVQSKPNPNGTGKVFWIAEEGQEEEKPSPETPVPTREEARSLSKPSIRKRRKSRFDRKRLKAIAAINDRREGSHGQHSLQIIIDNPSITYEEFLRAGGRRVDLAWDVERGMVEVR